MPAISNALINKVRWRHRVGMMRSISRVMCKSFLMTTVKEWLKSP